MRLLVPALCFATVLAACGGAIAPEAGDGGSGSSSGGSGSSSGTIVGSSSGVSGSSSGPVTGSSSSSGASGSGSTSSTSGSGGVSSGGIVDAMTTGCANGAPPPMQSAACNQCIVGFCNDSWCACAADSMIDDAGNLSGCLGFANCIIVCLNGDPEAGVPPQDGGIQVCAMLCATPYTPQQQAEGQSLLSCLAPNCTTECQ